MSLTPGRSRPCLTASASPLHAPNRLLRSPPSRPLRYDPGRCPVRVDRLRAGDPVPATCPASIVSRQAPRRTPANLRRPLRPDPLGVFRFEVPPCNLQVVVGLEIHREFRAVPEIQPQPHRRVGRNPASVVNDLGDPVRRDTDRLGKPVLRQALFGQELLLRHLAERDRSDPIRCHVRLHPCVSTIETVRACPSIHRRIMHPWSSLLLRGLLARSQTEE